MGRAHLARLAVDRPEGIGHIAVGAKDLAEAIGIDTPGQLRGVSGGIQGQGRDVHCPTSCLRASTSKRGEALTTNRRLLMRRRRRWQGEEGADWVRGRIRQVRRKRERCRNTERPPRSQFTASTLA
jgi:hypothetical protein